MAIIDLADGKIAGKPSCGHGTSSGDSPSPLAVKVNRAAGARRMRGWFSESRYCN